MDFDIFNGLLGVTADYYIKNTSDILLGYNVPTETGITAAPSQNIGKVKNTGFELALNHRNKIGAVNYSIGANIATNKNKITNLGGSDNIIQTSSYIVKYILKKGESIGSFYGFKTDGLYTQASIDAGHYYTLSGVVPMRVTLNSFLSVISNISKKSQMKIVLFLVKMYPILHMA